jgi:hypothetical protein
MSDDKKQQNSSTSSPNSTGNANTGNDIPYVPPKDRTNLNESFDFDTKPSQPPNIITKNDE